MLGFTDRAGSGLDMQVIPHPAVTLVVQLGPHPLRVGGRAERQVRGLVAGLTPDATRIRSHGVECIEVRLSPLRAFSLLGAPPTELAGVVVDIDDLWGSTGRTLCDRLAVERDWHRRFSTLHRLLHDRHRPDRTADPEVAAAWHHIVASGGQVRIGDLVGDGGWSRARLWARFRAQIGTSPKRAAMLIRFDRAARRLAAGERPVDVAAACGYADQSHLHRDVATFSGTTPAMLAGEARRQGTDRAFTPDVVTTG